MNVLSLFSGIGGIDLGLERAGMTITGQVEIDDYCQKVLKKHWPDVMKWKNIKGFNALLERLMLYAEDPPARTSRLLEKGQALEENEAVYGLKCSDALGYYDQDTSSWRTFQHLLDGSTFRHDYRRIRREWKVVDGQWKLSSTKVLRSALVVFKRAGMIRNGIVYRRPPLVPLTDVIGCSSLPTPTPHRKGNQSQGGGAPYRPSLTEMAEAGDFRRHWPTHRVAVLHGKAKPKKGHTHGWDLPAAVKDSLEEKPIGKFPTPTSRDYKDNASPGALARKSPGLGAIAQMYPTPTTPRPHDNENTAGKYLPSQNQKDLASVVVPDGGQLNPQWVEWLMGYPDGWTDLEGLETPSSHRLRSSLAEGSPERAGVTE